MEFITHNVFSVVTEGLQIDLNVSFPLWVITFMILVPAVVIAILVIFTVCVVVKKKKTVKEVQDELR